MKEAMKFDATKARLELVDPLAINGLAAVLEFGAKKYAVDNWRKGFAYTRIIGSLERHLNAIKAGELTDPESGLPHIDHVGANWMFLSFFMKERPDLNDIWYCNEAKVAEVEPTPNKPVEPAKDWSDPTYFDPTTHKAVLPINYQAFAYSLVYSKDKGWGIRTKAVDPSEDEPSGCAYCY